MAGKERMQALAEIRSMARTLEFSIADENQWDDEFRERWTALLIVLTSFAATSSSAGNGW